jgi:hypothetical protein
MRAWLLVALAVLCCTACKEEEERIHPGSGIPLVANSTPVDIKVTYSCHEHFTWIGSLDENGKPHGRGAIRTFPEVLDFGVMQHGVRVGFWSEADYRSSVTRLTFTRFYSAEGVLQAVLYQGDTQLYPRPIW